MTPSLMLSPSPVALIAACAATTPAPRSARAAVFANWRKLARDARRCGSKKRFFERLAKELTLAGHPVSPRTVQVYFDQARRAHFNRHRKSGDNA